MTGLEGPLAPKPTEFSVRCSHDAEGVVLTLSGQLDLASAPELEKRLDELLQESHASVVLDLSELSFVDSAGLTVLIRAKKRAEVAGRRIVLRRATAQVHRVFAVVGLADWLIVEDR